MNLLMISGDRSLASGKLGAFYVTLEELRKHWERIDVICPRASGRCVMVSGDEPSHQPIVSSFVSAQGDTIFHNVFLHHSPSGLWYQPLWILRKGKELCRQRQYNVMTVHDSPPFYNGLGAWLLHRAEDMPWIAEIHHVVGYPVAADFREWVGRRMYPLYLRTIGRKASAFRVVNAGTRDLLARWGVQQERIHVVPSFYLDHELLNPDPSIQKKYDVVFCGRLVVNKGIENLMEAIATVYPSTTLGMTQSLRLLVIGDGPLLQYLKAESYNLKTHVTFAGWLPVPRDVYRAIQSVKIFVMCSKSEGGPRVLLEAMALGLPVIATNVGVVPDVIRDRENGLITTGTPEDIAEKIRVLLADDVLRTRLGNNARAVIQKFERKKLIMEYAEFLQSFSYRIPSP